METNSAPKPLVAFLGPPSSFTHQATRSAFSDEDCDLVPVGTIKDVFDVVQAGEATYGVVPFENSTYGVVNFTLDNLADRNNTYGDLSVCGEVYIDVHHFLLGYQSKTTPPPGRLVAANAAAESESSGTSTPTPRAKPLHGVKHVQRIVSHPQAFGQTNAFLTTYLRGVDTLDVSSTSRAAEMASQDHSGATAAIAGEIAAEMFGLDVLARCIEDRDDNTTRFFIVRKGETLVPARRTRGEEEDDAAANKENKKTKSLVSFTVPHESPGGLAGVLDVFRKYGLNLTSINSLPSLIRPFQYLFFVEFEGSKFEDPEEKVKLAFEEVNRVAQGWRWLGSWESQR